MTHYDLVVLGAGSGNTIVDRRFAGWRVAIVERGPFGGTCLNRGCIPSKMLVAAADLARDVTESERLDVAATLHGVDWAALRERTFGRTDEIAARGREYREDQDHVDVLTGTARFTGPRQLVVALESGGEVELSADRVVIATGSRPVLPDVPGLADVDPQTSDTVMRMPALPARLAVVGGGYVGSELAHVFSSLGVAVTQLEAQDTLLTGQDPEIAEVFTRQASARWTVRLGTRLERVSRDDAGITLHLGDGAAPVVVDEVLVATGRIPNGDTLDLDRAGVETDDRGLVRVDDRQRTTAEGVWALGDASSEEPLKHVANAEARTVQHNLLHPADPVTSDHRFVPQAVFSSPQVARVGLTEPQAREQGLDLAVGRKTYAATAFGWAHAADAPDASGEEPGWSCKLLADRATGRLVGAHLVGPQAATLIQPLTMAMSLDLPVAGLARSQYWIHPAPTEVVEGALLELETDLSH